ncbi:MAG TPA: hypothetical protein VFV39_05185 [Limnobacter sp.]|nr:hypothetical protein [Limnobacter sp.]
MSKSLREIEPFEEAPALPDPLLARAGVHWMGWFSTASTLLPDLSRALDFLSQACRCIDDFHQHPTPQCERKLKQVIGKYIGQARCPSASSCERIAVRAHVVDGWISGEINSQDTRQLLIDCGATALQKLLQISEGADDKHGVLLRAVRTVTRNWLSEVARHVANPIDRAHCIYPVAMMDHAGLVDPAWWWKQLAECDRMTVLGLMDAEISAMEQTQPSTNVNWRSFDKRWRRLRLRGLLEFLGEKRLLSELLRKSAVDDFEAVEAIEAMQAAGRSREAIVQAEQWMRGLPRSAGLGQLLFDLYTNDGWDDEALALAKAQYEQDPNPVWLRRLERLNTPAAKSLVKVWRKQQA